MEPLSRPKGAHQTGQTLVIKENTLNEKEQAQYTAHEKEIRRALDKLRIIHQAAYR